MFTLIRINPRKIKAQNTDFEDFEPPHHNPSNSKKDPSRRSLSQPRTLHPVQLVPGSETVPNLSRLQELEINT